MEDRGCDTCKFKEEQLEGDRGSSRCNNCLHLTRKGREYFPNWEEEEDLDEVQSIPIIHYI